MILVESSSSRLDVTMAMEVADCKRDGVTPMTCMVFPEEELARLKRFTDKFSQLGQGLRVGPLVAYNNTQRTSPRGEDGSALDGSFWQRL